MKFNYQLINYGLWQKMCAYEEFMLKKRQDVSKNGASVLQLTDE